MRSSLKLSYSPVLFAAITFLTSFAFASSGITYQGRILKPDGTPLAGANVQFKMQIRTPDASNCLMYEELQALDMRNSNGVFALTINDGSGTRTDSTGWNIDRVFSNASGVANTFSFNPATCASGNSYLPNPSDGRSFVVYFKDETMSSYEPMPSQKINFVPLAFEAKQIAGFTPASLVRVAESDGTLDSVSPLSNANYTELLALINGTTTQYEKAGKISGVAVPSMTTGQVLGWNGSAWTSVDPLSGVQTFAKTVLPTCGAGQFLKDNGSGLLVCATPASSGGTVTQVNTGTGLTGGGFTTSGTISIAAGGVGTTELAANAVTTAKIADLNVTTLKIADQNVTTAKLADANVTLAKLAADSVDSSKIADGSITGADLNAGINITTSGTIVSGVNTTRDFKLYPAGAGTNKISFAAPLALAADYTITFPLTAGGASQVLTTDGSGNLSWSTPAGTGISALTGDVTASGSGSVAATVAAVGGVTAANVATGANLANAATNLNTASTIVKRDASGNFAASAVTETSTIYKDTGANTVTVQAPTTVTSSYVMKWPTGVAASAGQVLSSDTSGNLSWSSLPTSMAPSGSAGGDLSGSYPNPSVATVGGSTAANVNTATVAANAATAVNTASKIVARDASGNFAAGVATLNGVALNNAGSILNITNPVGGAWNMTLPATAGSNGQVMATNGAGVMSWLTPLTSSTGFVNGGNSFGANASVGTNDAFRLDVKTNNTVAMTVDSTGKVGIGTTAPATALDVPGVVSFGSLTNAPRASIDSTGPISTFQGARNYIALKNDVNVSGTMSIGATFFANDMGATPGGLIVTGKAGFGTLAPQGPLSVSPIQYSAGSASQSGTSVTGVGTSWTAAMLGSQFVFDTGINGGTITAVNSPTSLTVSNSLTQGSRGYSINYQGFQVTSTGSVGIGTAAPATSLEVAGTLKVGDGGETCGASYAGGVRYNGGNIQFCNGTSWSTLGVAGAGISALTGDVTASGAGSVAATVAQVGGVTAANVATGANSANAATNLNTASTIVKRDASGNFAASGITSTSNILKDTGANTVTLSAPTSVTASYSLKFPVAVAASAGQVLASDTSGNMSWSTIPTALPPNGSAGGDLSGSYPNPTVATIGTSTAAQVHSAELAANAATAANTASTIVSRDASGNFAAGVVTANGVALKNAGSILNITNPVGGAWNMTLPATAGSNGQVMQTNGSGIMTWATPLTSATGFINGGNSFGANASIGTNDAFRLDVKTNNAVAMTIDSAGKVGIGTTAPSSALEVVGDTTVARLITKTPFANTVLIGQGTSTANVGGTLVGANASSNVGYGVIAIGNNAVANGDRNIAIGEGSSVTGAQEGIAIGEGASVTQTDGIALGYVASSPYQGSIALGTQATSTAAGQAVFGSSAVPTSDLYLGKGVSAAAPGISSVNATSGLGANIAGGNLELKAGAGTGTGVGGYVAIKTAAAGGSGSTANALTERMRIASSGNVGIGTTSPGYNLDVSGSIASNDKIYVTKPGYIPSYITMTGVAPDNGNFEIWTRHGMYTKNLDITSNQFIINGAGQGNAGIGTTAPATKLEVAGSLKIGDGGETCGATYAGAVRYNGGAIQFCNGTAWGALGGAAASSVAASAGSVASPSITFSGDSDTGLYSNGANVIGVSAGGSNVFNISSGGLVSPTTGGASVTTANGTAAAPTYSFAGDTGTGWWRPAASTMAASTGGSERVRIDLSGNVGIGTTAPATASHIVKTETSTTAYTNHPAAAVGASVTDFSYVPSAATNTAASANYTRLIESGAGYTGSVVAVQGDTSTYSQAGGWATGVSGNVMFHGNGGGATGINGFATNLGSGTLTSAAGVIGSGYSQSTGTTVYVIGGDFYANHQSGTVGEMTGVQSTISLPGGTSTQNDIIGLKLNQSGTGTTPVSYGVYIGNQVGTTKYSVFSTDTAASAYYAGRVGIGTSTPAGTLDVEGGTAAASTNGTSINLVAQGSATSTFKGGNININAGAAFGGEWWNAGNITMTANNVSIGSGSLASGGGAAALGASASAGGQGSVSLGWQNSSSGFASAALGNFSLSNGNYSTSIGNNSRSPAYASTVVGACNAISGTENSGAWVATDPIFAVGNGTSAGGGSCTTNTNAMTILKNGKVGIGTTAPADSLDLASKTDAITLPRGTTAQRPSSPVNGMMRYNTDSNNVEAYVNGAWVNLITNITPSQPAGTGGTGYFVLTNSTYDGNLGGLAGANTKCRTELSAGTWKNKPGALDTAKVFAFLCDDSGCQNPNPNASFYYAVVGDTSIGGSGFSTNGSGSGVGDTNALTSSDRFGVYGGEYWSGTRSWGSATNWDTNVIGTGSCLSWSTNSSGNTGARSDAAQTSNPRFWGSTGLACNNTRKLICFVNP